MNTHHLSFYISALEKVHNRKKFLELLNSLEESFLPYATFTSHVLPVFESKLRDIEKEAEEKGVDENPYLEQELKDNKRLIEIGKFLEEERKKLSEEIRKVQEKKDHEDFISHDECCKKLLDYLKEFNIKLKEEDEIITQMLHKLELFETYLEHIVKSVKKADNILIDWKNQLGEID
ncbi:hypothetical protein C0585_02425 [Candidatus Woesearchaeota archaeon]|nr:MAG: hypothetical protein C0585_02425 [Candidatus Woesearchaeota archaeon]